MIIDSTTHKQADAEKAMHPTALRLGYCGPRINPLNSTKSYFSNARILKFQEVSDRVCSELGVNVIKVGIPNQEWDKGYQYKDGVHPNKRGYEEIFNKILEAL